MSKVWQAELLRKNKETQKMEPTSTVLAASGFAGIKKAVEEHSQNHEGKKQVFAVKNVFLGPRVSAPVVCALLSRKNYVVHVQEEMLMDAIDGKARVRADTRKKHGKLKLKATKGTGKPGRPAKKKGGKKAGAENAKKSAKATKEAKSPFSKKGKKK